MNTVEELNKIEKAQALYYSWEDEYEEYCDSQDENDDDDETRVELVEESILNSSKNNDIVLRGTK